MTTRRDLARLGAAPTLAAPYSAVLAQLGDRVTRHDDDVVTARLAALLG